MIRSVVFNLVYYIGTLVIGVLILPSLLLPERIYLPFIRQYFRFVALLAKYLLGLTYQIEGQNYIPAGTNYIVAAKHQSAFETLLLPVIFDHPVVVLKRELLQIPFWGWYAAKAGNIGINRSQPRAAIAQMLAGVKDAASRGRTVVIFPQGTRVGTHDTPAQKPYKRGIAEMYKALNIPVVPMALNSGIFWGRNAFFKRPGTATIKFLPPILPGLSEADFMQRLEHTLETESALLVEQALEGRKLKRRAKPINILLGTIAFLIYLYTGAWFGVAYMMQREVNRAWENAPQNGMILSPPPARVTGYPGKFRVVWHGTIQTPDAELSLRSLDISFWPIPTTPATLRLADAHIVSSQASLPPGSGALDIQKLDLTFEIPAYLPPIWIKREVQKLYDRQITYRLLSMTLENAGTGPIKIERATGSGALVYDENLQPDGTLDLVFSNPDQMRDTLTLAVAHPMGKSFISGVVDSLAVADPVTGTRTLPLTLRLKNGSLYAGPLKIAYIGHIYWPVADPASGVPLSNFDAPAPTSTSPLTR